MECFLCLKLKSDKTDLIKFKSSTWEELQVELLIEKHLWPMTEFKMESILWLCLSCWHTIHDFHKFYKYIENVHINYDSLIKCETDLNFNTDENISKDFLSENLAEPEIDIGHESIASLKEENEEDCDSLNKNHDEGDDEDDIPLIHISGKRRGGSLEDHITSNEQNLEDPLDKTNKTKSKKRKAKTSPWKSIKKNIENESSDHSTANERIQKSIDKSSGGLIAIEYRESHLSTSYFHQSGMSCREYDKFIGEYFKLTCHKCQLPFDMFTELQTHFRESHKARGYVICCETKIYDRGLLVDHINMHMNPEYFKCKYCPKVLTLRRNFNIHMKSHDQPLSCDICGKKFERKCFLNYHRQTHMSKEEKNIPCPDCGKFFASQYLLTNHRRVIHLRKYAKLCNICGQSLINLEAFKRHMKLHDDKTGPPLSCEFCGLLVSSERYLKAHIKSKHTVADTEKVCPICLKVLQNADGLRHHIRRNHNTGYIHKCTICEKAFKRIDHLKAHMNIHTGADKSKCPWCPRTFNANSSMHHHRKQVHRKEWEEERRKKYIEKLPMDLETEQAIRDMK